METIKKLEQDKERYILDSKKCEDCKNSYGYCKDHLSLITDVDSVIQQTEGICFIIRDDIEFQKTQLKNDFEKDKSINWRIVGFEYLLNKITGDAVHAVSEAEGKDE